MLLFQYENTEYSKPVFVAFYSFIHSSLLVAVLGSYQSFVTSTKQNYAECVMSVTVTAL